MNRRALFAVLLVVVFIAGACRSGQDPTVSGTDATSTTAGEEASTTSSEAPPATEPEPPATTSPPVVDLAGTNAPVIVTTTNVVATVVSREADGVTVLTPCGERAKVARGTPVAGATVVLDPGHGGRESGAVGPGGLTEKEVNDAVSGYAKAALEAAGESVVLTRNSDHLLTLASRAAIVKALSPKAFVSVHHNAEPDEERSSPGTETYYQIGGPPAAAAASKRLAGLVFEEVNRALSAFSATWVADRDAGAKYRPNSRGDDYYGILRLTQGIPAVLSEAAFMSNPEEEALLRREEVRRAEGEAVARAIIRFLHTDDPGTGYTEPYPREEPAGGGGGRAGCVDPPMS